MATPNIATAGSSNGVEGSTLSPAQLFEITRVREEALSRLLIAFVTTGLFFMVSLGTFLGVWNLLQISGRESVVSISPAWLQAHGHAQLFGWVGSFILGIGFYSIPKMRGARKFSFATAWVCWAMWTMGAALRWTANVYLWEWRLLLPKTSGSSTIRTRVDSQQVECGFIILRGLEYLRAQIVLESCRGSRARPQKHWGLSVGPRDAI